MKQDCFTAIMTSAGTLVSDESKNPAVSKKRGRELAADEAAKRAKVRAPALVVFGLGNTGEDHAKQRHNIGERVILAVAKRKEATLVESRDGAAGVRSVPGSDRPWFLLPPQGGINDSGTALRAALQALAQPSAQFLVVSDDIALPLGVIRLRAKGSSGGHNALKSIESNFDDKYHRLKIGIGGARVKEHVIGEPSEEEEGMLSLAVERAAEAVESWLSLGPEEIQKVLAHVNSPEFCTVKKPSELAGGAEAVAGKPQGESTEAAKAP